MGVACARSASAAVSAVVAGVSSPCVRGSLASCVAPALHARATASPVHGARNSSVPSQGPRGRKGTKGGVSGPVEVCVLSQRRRQGPAGRVRRQVVGHVPRRQRGPGTWWSGSRAVTPSIHPEVPDSLGADWASCNQWARGRSAVPRGRRSGS